MLSRTRKISLFLLFTLLGTIVSGIQPAQAIVTGTVEHAKTEQAANFTRFGRLWDGLRQTVTQLGLQSTNILPLIPQAVNMSFLRTPMQGHHGQRIIRTMPSMWYCRRLASRQLSQANHEIRVLEASTATELGTYYTAANFDNPLQSGCIRVNGDPGEYALVSSNQLVRIAFHKRYGGAITKVYNQDQGNINLIDDDQGGALFQTAFWLIDNPQYPEVHTCGSSLSNPTQGGVTGSGAPGSSVNGHTGNPIELMAAGPTLDGKEFIGQANGKIHLKTRFIRFDYCGGNMTSATANEWDTTFYLEQWAYFSAAHPTTLVLDSTITNDGSIGGSVTRQMTTRQLPVIFARHLPKLGHYIGATSNTPTIPLAPLGAMQSSDYGVSPSTNWAALVNAGPTYKGIGMVISPTTTMMLNEHKIGSGGAYDPPFDPTQPFTTLYPGGPKVGISGGAPDLADYGQSIGSNSRHHEHPVYNG